MMRYIKEENILLFNKHCGLCKIYNLINYFKMYKYTN